MNIQSIRAIGVGERVLIRNGAKEPSRRQRAKHALWSRSNFVGKIMEVHDDAVKVLDLDHSSGHCIITRWFTDDSQVTIIGQKLYKQKQSH